MENKGSSCPIDMCEKIYKKVTVSPAFHTIRRISHHLQPSRYASPTSDIANAIHSKPARHPRSGDGSLLSETPTEAAGVVPINFEYSHHPPVELIRNNTQVMQIAHKKNEPEATPAKQKPSQQSHVKSEEGEKSGVHIEDRFTEYLNRTKSKIRRTITNPGEGKNASGSGNDKSSNNAASGKDKFTDYIERTKKKLRITSNKVAGGRRNSFK